MADEKCFSSFNGYQVKDKNARNQIDDMRSGWLEVADLKIFGVNNMKNISPGVDYSQQGFAIGNVSGKTIVLCGACDNASYTGTLLAAYDLTNDSMTYKEGLELNHVNGICFCPDDELFYIACDGGTLGSIHKVVAVNADLEVVKTIDMGSVQPCAIAYLQDDKKWLVMNAYTANEVLIYDHEWIAENRTTFSGTSGDSLTYQAFSSDGKYLYSVTNGLNYGSAPHFNKVDVFNLEGMKYEATVFVPLEWELEQVCEYNGDMYFMIAKGSTGYIYKGSIRNSVALHGMRESERDFPKFSTDSKTIWIRSDYNGFLIDGSYSNPFPDLYVAFQEIRDNRYTKFDIRIVGDFSNSDINFRGVAKTPIFITGYSDETTKGNAKVNGVLFDGGNVTLECIESVGLREGYTMNFTNCVAEMISCVMSPPNPDTGGCLKVTKANVKAKNCTFYTGAHRNVNVDEMSKFTIDNCTINGGWTATLFSGNVIVASALSECSLLTAAENSLKPKIAARFLTGSVDFFAIKQPGEFAIAAAVEKTNAPEGNAGNAYHISVTPVNTNQVIIVAQDVSSTDKRHYAIRNHGGTGTSWYKTTVQSV